MRRVMTAATSLLLLCALIAGIGWLYVRGDLNGLICGGACPAQYATAPDQLLAVSAAEPTADGVGEEPVASNALKQAVAGPLAAPALGSRTGFVAVDARDGTPLAGHGDQALAPASTTKLLTAFAALEALGPAARFETRVVRDGDTLTLVGGGDPYLVERLPDDHEPVTAADLATLADAVVRELGTGTYRLAYDATLFTGPAISPAWEESYVPAVVTPVSALWIDQGRRGGTHATDPAREAAEAFSRLLGERGLQVTELAAAPAAESASEIALVRSAPVAAIVGELLRSSNNETAEVLLRQIAIASGQEASFEGGAAAVQTVLEQDAVFVEGLRLHDGSGLSRGNRISPTTLVQTLVAAGREGRKTAMLSGLPVGGFEGTVRSRFAQSPSGLGWVRAKTGTLTGIHSLAGIATLPGSRPVAFAVIADQTAGINPLQTQAALDAVAAAIADCDC